MNLADQLDADTIEALHRELLVLACREDQAVVALVEPGVGIVVAVERSGCGRSARWTFPVVVGRLSPRLWLAGACEEPSEELYDNIVALVPNLVEILDYCLPRPAAGRSRRSDRTWSSAA